MTNEHNGFAGLTDEQAEAIQSQMRWAAEQAGWQGAALALEAFAERIDGATLDGTSEAYAVGATEAFHHAAELAREQAQAIRTEKLTRNAGE